MSLAIAEPQVPVTETTIESVLLDADLFVKYSSPEKAFALLRESLERSPRSIQLREKMRDICVKQKNLNEAAKQCLALVSLYIGREDFDLAYDRLQEAKLLDPRISVAPGLEAIRRARRPDFAVDRDRTPQKIRTDVTFAGNLAYVSIFDAVQVIESAKMTGLMMIKSDLHLGNVSFNEGKIVDAECNGNNGHVAFRDIIEINSGTFEFNISDHEFPVIISISSNTNFLLDVLTELDNERAEKQGLRNVGGEMI
jgi:tetratricopeptide (TPR) repeat protein